MTILKKSICWLSLLSLFFSLMICYASLTDNLFIYGEGNVEGKPFVGIYIYDVEVQSANGASSVSHEHFKPTNLNAVAKAEKSGGSITYKITLHNNSNVTYWYVKQEFLNDIESNALIGVRNGITVTAKDHPSDEFSLPPE